jgi:trehalose-phosphatase
MSDLQASLCEQLVAVYRGGHRLLLLVDYDSTLVPIAPHPEPAVLDRRSRRLLANLARLPRVSVGVISGRSLDDLEGMVGLDEVYYAGVSGLELELAGGTRFRHPAATQAVVTISQVLERLEAIVADLPGAWIENKQIGLTAHFRQLPVDLVPALRARVMHIVQEVSKPLRIVDGPMALEITPAGDCHKGRAVRAVLQCLGSVQATCLYAGDDANDADAFAEVAAGGGVCLGVGPQLPAGAQYRLDGPVHLMATLDDLYQELCAPG